MEKNGIVNLIHAGWVVEVERPTGNRVRVEARLRGAVRNAAPRDVPGLAAVRFPGGPRLDDLVAGPDGGYTAVHDTPGVPNVREIDLLICSREGLAR